MIDRVPAIAPLSPPLTGASSISAPAAVGAAGEVARDARRDRAHVDREPAGSERLERAVRAQVDLLDLGRVGQHRDEDVAGGGDFARRRGRRGAFGGELRDRVAIDVVDDQLDSRP